jgi:hypothetical protein
MEAFIRLATERFRGLRPMLRGEGPPEEPPLAAQ